jgi:tetratricopeptide (TPR) repeat protein
MAAAFTAAFFFSTLSLVPAQWADEASELNKKIIELYKAGRYSEAVPIAERVLAIREKALGPEHPDVANSLNNLAALYVEQGRYADAEPLHQRSLAIREKALVPEHPDIAKSLNYVAILYYYQGRYADAEPLFQRSWPFGKRRSGTIIPISQQH